MKTETKYKISTVVCTALTVALLGWIAFELIKLMAPEVASSIASKSTLVIALWSAVGLFVIYAIAETALSGYRAWQAWKFLRK